MPKMPEAVAFADLTDWRECGISQRLPDIPDGKTAICAPCDTLLQRAARDSIAFRLPDAKAEAATRGATRGRPERRCSLGSRLKGSVFSRLSSSSCSSPESARRARAFGEPYRRSWGHAFGGDVVALATKGHSPVVT